VSTAYASDPVEFRVTPSPTADGPFTRIVIYDWFTRGPDRAPPRGGNAAEVLVDGEASWQRVAEDLAGAQREVWIATWMCRPDHELERPEELALREPAERAHLRLGQILETLAARGARVRLLVWGMVYTPIADRWMRRWFWRGRDNIDVLEQDHPILIGSHHQKTITIDGRVGYCGGMNLKENDWDTIGHDAFDARRFPHRAGPEHRAGASRRREPSRFPPRHDLMLRVEGPVVGDLLRIFAERWQQSLRQRRRSRLSKPVDSLRRRLGTKPHPELPPPGPAPAAAGKHWVQIVRTTPGGEQGILGAYYRAIYNARRYIYIENQYFRSPLIAHALQRAVQRNPRLRLIVVVRPVNDGRKSLLDPSAYWTAYTQARIRDVRPDFRLTRLVVCSRAADEGLHWVPVDVHAKAMVIDDAWLTVGSANINDRGFRYEGEINAVVLDKQLARNLRIRLMAEHLEIPATDERLRDVDAAFDLWERHADENPLRMADGEPARSRVHHFVQQSFRHPPFGVGSGIF
jgi:phosphatidylserine/phosphatidylglycerophosphate/cardiolipin synthase-like enzyme